MKTKLNKGQSVIDLDIPDDKILNILIGKDTPALGHVNISRIVSEGIKTHSPPDIAGKKIVIIIPDNTRLWARGDLYVPTILKTLFKMGVDKKNVRVIIALGTHSDIPEEDFPALAGLFTCQTVDIINSGGMSRDRLAFIGTTHKKTDLHVTKEAAQADHIIIFGGILHHMLAGFGGGRKYILPGIAGYDSICQNHSLAIRKDGTPHPLSRQGKLWGNPVNEDLNDAAWMFLKDKTCTYVAVAANGTGDIFHAAVGDLHETFMDSCRILNQVCCPPVSQKGDFAIISTGGHRTDTQLYQSIKALFNAVNIVKTGGDILFIAECEKGVGNARFEKMLSRYLNAPGDLGARLVDEFDMPSYVAFRLIDVLGRFNVTLYSDLSKDLTQALGFQYVDNFAACIAELKGKGYIIPYGENILPVMEKPTQV